MFLGQFWPLSDVRGRLLGIGGIGTSLSGILSRHLDIRVKWAAKFNLPIDITNHFVIKSP
jgi:hypothetical protein